MIRMEMTDNWTIRPVKGTGIPAAEYGPAAARAAAQDWEITTDVPMTALQAMLDSGLIDDPFYRKNEYAVREVCRQDFVFRKVFVPDEKILASRFADLVFEGLDTLADITLNGQALASCDNMHRTWRIPVQDLLCEGENTLEILFRSPLEFIDRTLAENPDIPYYATGCLPGNYALRKAHCMFGWDWGPQLPDAGLSRPVYLEAYDARLDNVFVHQETNAEQSVLTISADVTDGDGKILASSWKDRTSAFSFEGKEFSLAVKVTSPAGETFRAEVPAEEPCVLRIDRPQLWWPNNMGQQPLYEIEVSLLCRASLEGTGSEEAGNSAAADGGALDAWSRRIGLRSLEVCREKDEFGEEFCFSANGVKFFAMGADYIPEDNLLCRVTPEKTRRLLEDAAAANFNCIRVWGGGVYPSDTFFDVCDELGLVIWEDAMFACNVYRYTEAFDENVRAELKDNLIRIRHHASLGLLCGNNEMEAAWLEWNDVKSLAPALKADYIKQFEYAMPQVVKKYAPDTFYWPSSPSSGGSFDAPSDENRGDVHYWTVWHGMKPFTDYEKYYFRFCSEFGFESFPSLKTVKSYTEPEDRNIFSPVMESHQKNGAANGLIMYYVSSYYRYPKDFASLLYISQLLQAEAIRFGVEHWRRNRGRCMGAVYWQLNDCWPVASWSSIDYCGRWKALHYAAKRFFAPKLVSTRIEDGKLRVWIANDTADEIAGDLVIRKRDFDFALLAQASVPVRIGAYSASEIELPADAAACFESGDSLLLAGIPAVEIPEGAGRWFIAAELQESGTVTAKNDVMPLRPKQVDLPDPELTVSVEKREEGFLIRTDAKHYAVGICLTSSLTDIPLSDNWFDITGREGVEVFLPEDASLRGTTAETLAGSLTAMSVYDTYD